MLRQSAADKARAIEAHLDPVPIFDLVCVKHLPLPAIGTVAIRVNSSVLPCPQLGNQHDETLVNSEAPYRSQMLQLSKSLSR